MKRNVTVRSSALRLASRSGKSGLFVFRELLWLFLCALPGYRS